VADSKDLDKRRTHTNRGRSESRKGSVGPIGYVGSVRNLSGFYLARKSGPNGTVGARRPYLGYKNNNRASAPCGPPAPADK